MTILDMRSSIKTLINSGEYFDAILVVLGATRNEWDDLLSPECLEDSALDYSICDLSELERALNGLAQNASMLAEYIGHRGTYGCGDSGHDKAFKAAEKKLKKVRKAIGYTYP